MGGLKGLCSVLTTTTTTTTTIAFYLVLATFSVAVLLILRRLQSQSLIVSPPTPPPSTTKQATTMLTTIPEELQSLIISLSLSLPPTQSFTTPQEYAHHAHLVLSRPSILRVCRSLNRIALPVFYKEIRLSNKKQAQKFIEALERREGEREGEGEWLKECVESVVFGGVWGVEGGWILRECGANLRELEYVLDKQPSASRLTWGGGGGGMEGRRDADVEAFGEALRELKGVRVLTVKKAPNLYVTSPRARGLLDVTARAISGWEELVSLSPPLSLSLFSFFFFSHLHLLIPVIRSEKSNSYSHSPTSTLPPLRPLPPLPPLPHPPLR